MSERHTQVANAAAEELSFQRYRLAPSEGEAFLCDTRLMLIGTSPEADLILDDPTVSRLHGRIEFDHDGYRLEDLGSKNGVWLNGIRVREAYIPDGATLRFGETEVRFTLDAQRVSVSVARATQFGDLLGASLAMREIFGLLQRVAPTDAPIWIEGEGGTGKELVAETLHLHSKRRAMPFVIFDCSAVAPDAIERELFGAVEGEGPAEVGAMARAEGGTLFIDALDALPLEVQPTLLRCLERKSYRPIGGGARTPTDARIIAATDQRLNEAVAQGTFREDLYYRLAVVRIRLPPLRQRPEDIPLLVNHFVTGIAARTGGKPLKVGYDTMTRLTAHRWPGNIRELKTYVERAVVLAERGRLETRHLTGETLDADVQDPSGALPLELDRPFKDAKARLIAAFERRYWDAILEATGGNISEAARRGGIHRKSLEYLLKKLAT